MLETNDCVLNPLDPAYHANPYPFMAQQLEQASVHWNPVFQAWGVCAYDDVKTALSLAHTSANRVESIFARLEQAAIDAAAPTRALLKRWALFADGADHKNLRSLMNEAFAPRIIKNLRPSIERLVTKLIANVKEKLEAGKTVDIVHEIAVPLPAIVIGEILGIPNERIDWLKQLSVDIAGIFNLSSRPDPIFAERGQAALLELCEFLQQRITEKKAQPQDDLMSVVVDEKMGMSEADMLGTLSLMLLAGHETTTNVIANGVLNLMRHPSAYAQLRADRSLIPSAIEEMLRFESPVQISSRVLTEDTEIGGQALAAHQRIILFLGAANRDPAVFEHPDVFDIARTDNRHIAFGHGKHFCVGAGLARLEAECFFNEFLTALPALSTDLSAVQWRPDVSLRGLKTLPVQLA